MKTLVIGARGMLGVDLRRVLADHGREVLGLDLPEFDIRDPQQVMQLIARERPAQVMHLAALTDVDACQLDPDAAYATNTAGTRNVALACEKNGAELVYISTLAVFNGEKPSAYTELDQPDPRSVYSRSKQQGEALVRQIVSRHYIARAGWMFGGGRDDKKFVGKILALARQRRELRVVDDKFGSPTYTLDFARGLLRLIETGWYGTFHLVNTGAPASRCEVAEHILRLAGLTQCQIIPVSSDQFPLPAPRPRMEAGQNYLLEQRGCDWMRPWPAALQEYLAAFN